MSKETEMIREYTKLATVTSEALTGLKKAIEDMNEQNVLHTNAIKDVALAVNNIDRFWGKITFILVIAITILAGLEKFGKLIGIQ